MNEKYKGDALLQKSYTVDYLTKKTKVNEGEIPQYYVEGDHEAIIDPDVFDQVQIELEKRCPGRNRHSGVHDFSGKIKCGQCGSWYGSKVWHSTDKYRRVIWQCNHKYKGAKCSTPHLTDAQIKNLFIQAVNKLITNKGEILNTLESIYVEIINTEPLEEEMEKRQGQIAVITARIEQLIEKNAHTALDQNNYLKQYNDLVSEYNKKKKRIEKLQQKIKDIKARKVEIDLFLKNLSKQDDLVTTFSKEMFICLTDHIVVYGKQDIRFVFKNGSEIKIGLRGKKDDSQM